MGADFVRIRREMDKLGPSFSQALDRAFELMKEHELEFGGDNHHGLMKSIWPKFGSFKKAPWNLVRLPRQVHAKVHALYAAAFVDTGHFDKFNSARVLMKAPTGSYLDEQLWQKRIQKFTIDGIFYVGDFAKRYDLRTPSNIHLYAKRRGIRTADNSEAQRTRFSSSSKAQIIRFYRAGNSLEFISKKFYVSQSNIWKWLKEWGVKIRSTGEARSIFISSSDQARIIQLYLKGDSPESIGKKFHVGHNTIRKKLKEWGVEIRNRRQAQRLRRSKRKAALGKGVL